MNDFVYAGLIHTGEPPCSEDVTNNKKFKWKTTIHVELEVIKDKDIYWF